MWLIISLIRNIDVLVENLHEDLGKVLGSWTHVISTSIGSESRHCKKNELEVIIILPRWLSTQVTTKGEHFVY